MKAMLDPRIVAASTHDSEFPAQGVAKVPARMIDSSHGCLMQGVDAKRTPRDSLDHVIFRQPKEDLRNERRVAKDKNLCATEESVLPESAAVAHFACRVLEEIVDVLMGLGLQSSFRLDALGNLDRRSQPYIRV